MLKKINLIRNIGCFDSYSNSHLDEFKQLVLIYAENGRGKTTISSIFSSLAYNDAIVINGRKRLGSANDPHIVLTIDGESDNTIFQSGNWNIHNSHIFVYDDEFINQNVFSGLEINASHRQKLHEVILGRAGVSLARKVQILSQLIADSNNNIREISNQIPVHSRFGIELDVFCSLKEIDNIEQLITDKQVLYDAMLNADISKKNLFSQITFPSIDMSVLDGILLAELSDLDSSSVKFINEHFTLIGENAEKWVSDGMRRIIKNPNNQEEKCPFCTQNINRVDLLSKYKAYFGESYNKLIRQISGQINYFSSNFSGDILSSKQVEINNLKNLYEFWKNFIKLPAIEINWGSLSIAWQEAREGVLALLQTKRLSPLNPVALVDEIKTKIERYLTLLVDLTRSIKTLMDFNQQITILKQQADSGNLKNVANELNLLKATQSRYSDELKDLCDQYQREIERKKSLETQKDTARISLDAHRQAVFSKYHTAINNHLESFGASFRIGNLESSNAAGRPSTIYHIEINQHQVSLENKAAPCFKNALSAGDRNTLGLAFFFSSLENEPNLNNSIIVLDDPISSLDEGRTTTTIQKIRNLLSTTKQVIILCHFRKFLCDIWEHSYKNNTTALKIFRDTNNTSNIATWDVSSDAFTEYDKRHKILRDYVVADTQEKQIVAQSLRPVMEKYLRITFPEYCIPGTLLGNFYNQAENLSKSGKEIMDAVSMGELKAITDYANKFHHDTNPAWETEQISDSELLGFVKRVLNFVKHGTI
ncbi:MAG: hypothetical protein A2Y10_03575 [Planctomycetes bacterium GWF2_41_51]|nr:MAG: hypothetical protein A2Y10_03575 [Planctomycetes bacterium GWF2_41_51]HBG28823.1 hypothetical protein [Phycisphaerales bacterium]